MGDITSSLSIRSGTNTLNRCGDNPVAPFDTACGHSGAMEKNRLFLFEMTIFLGALCILGSSLAFAHSGDLDSYGCHHNHDQGDYHCHQGSLKERHFTSKEAMQRALQQQSYRHIAPTPGAHAEKQ